MAIYAIGDLHLDSTKQKPMDIFGENWIEHEDKIFANWEKKVTKDDIVLIPGDISWAMKLEDAKVDLGNLEILPGKKIMIRGNHDYWWATKNKLLGLNFSTIDFLVNDHIIDDGFFITGVRGWDSNSINLTAQDKKIFEREFNRLEHALNFSMGFSGKKIVMLHYPPFYADKKPNAFVSLLEKYGVDICIYGHLHGKEGHKTAVEGKVSNTEFLCVASDYLNFDLKKLAL